VITRRVIPVLVSIVITMLAAGCFRGMPSDKPPIKIVKGMDNQPKYKPQSSSAFFPDGAAMRTPVPGTVARGQLHEDSAFFAGLDDKGQFLQTAPMHITPQLLQRGRERFDIYCSPCHGRLGDGNGIVVERGYIPPPSFHGDRLRQVADGYIFDVITNGVRNMPSYADQVPPEDRWAIVVYLRALQRSQNARLGDVPEELRGKIR
jgi:mono/diheme cytochrome c family protein